MKASRALVLGLLPLVGFLCVAGAKGQRHEAREAREDSRAKGKNSRGAEAEAPPTGQQVGSSLPAGAAVPRLVKFSGTLKYLLGKPLGGTVGVTFSIYRDREDGAALWVETQYVELDEQGQYTVLLGSTKSEGLPLELFTAGEPRWLGVQVNLPKEVEQPRALLVSVPYALKAADAETLGGKPLSSFVLASPTRGGGAGVGTVFPITGATGAATIGGGGTQNFVTKFDATGTNVVNSQIFDTGTNVGIGTSSPARTLHLKSAAPTMRLEDTNLPNSFWELQQSAFVLDTFGFLRYENGAAVQDKSFVVSSAGNLGIGTGQPQRKLHIRSLAPVIRLEDTNLPNSFWELQQSAFFLDTFGFLRYENGSAVQSKSFVMSSAGNFGIGTAAPSQKLEVAGIIKISGAGNGVMPGNVQITTPGKGIVVQSPDGTKCRQMGIDNTGSRVMTAVPCGPVRTIPDKFLYAVNEFCLSNPSNGCISIYTIDGTTGALTSAAGPVPAGADSVAMAVDPLARFAYVLNAQSEDVSMYTINSTTGSLVPTPPPPVVNTIPAGPSPFFIAVHPSGGFTYVVTSPFPGLNPPTIFVYTINATTGALTPTTPIAGGGLAITIHPSGNFAYVIANGASGPPSCGGAACTSTYMVNATTGTLTLVGSVLTSLASPVVVRPSGKFAYALSGDFPNTVVVFAIDDITGKLTLISTASTRLSPSSVAVDAFGKFAYVTNHGANNVTAYTIDATTGALTEVGTVSTGSGPMWITVERSGKFAYVLDSDPSCLLSSISIYKIDGNTGLLLPSGKACANDGIGKMLVTSGPIP